MMQILQYPMLIPLVLLLSPAVAQAINPAQWQMFEQINRGDSVKTWTSPTAVDLGKMLWKYDFQITKVTGTVNVFLIGDITQDITNSIPPGRRAASGETRDLPAAVLEDTLVDATTGTSADVLVEIDNLGFGRVTFSNIELGSVAVPLFGNRPIQRINIEANAVITAYDFGDYNRDGSVDAADYIVWRKTLGQVGISLVADGSGNITIDRADYNLWRAHFGQVRGSGAAAEVLSPAIDPVPEPATFLIALGVAFARILRGRIRSAS